jgi:phenylpropionate dioxygenase-like ring-hydroxylating dioxygenase large terminal subunit
MLQTAFPRNQWYVAAYASQVGRDLLARTILGDPIVLYRTRSGAPVALADRCVHRRFPLSHSRLDGDRIVCGYHGFTYDPSGACVSVPAQHRVPRTARVTRYPVVEQDSFIWVWIGAEELADPAAVPRAPWLAGDGWTTVSGMAHVPARYALVIDNLMDLSHETYLHAGTIGTPEVAATPITTQVDDNRGIVFVSRHMVAAECPAFYATSTGITGRIDRWQDIEYHPPCLYQLHVRVAPTGVAPGPDGDDSGAFHVEVVYAVTPETEHTTHLAWAVARDFAHHDPQVSQFLHRTNRTVVEQDIAALTTLEQVLATDGASYRELSVNIDTGGLGARRLLKRMLRAGVRAGEQPAAAAPATSS